MYTTLIMFYLCNDHHAYCIVPGDLFQQQLNPLKRKTKFYFIVRSILIFNEVNLKFLKD